MISARLTTAIDKPGVRFNDIEAHIARGGIRLEIDQACGMGEFRPLARLELSQVISPAAHDTAFDPTTHSDPEVTPFPGWLTDFAGTPTGVAARAATAAPGCLPGINRALRPFYRQHCAQRHGANPR